MPHVDNASPGGLARRPVPQHLDTDALTAYLDGRIEPDARSAAAAHLAACPDCRREVAELRTTVDVLRGLPQYRPRRSFQLGPAYARSVHGNRLARFLPLLPALRTAAAVCALVLAVVTAADVLIDEEQAPGTSTEPVVVDEVVAPPANAREPTGRDPLVEDEVEADTANAPPPNADAGMSAASNEGVGETASDEAADGVAGAQAPAPAPVLEERPDAGVAADDAAAAGGFAEEPRDQPAGGDLARGADPDLAEPAAPVAQPRGDPSDDDGGLTSWQVAQLGLGLALAALVAALVVLQRLANRARRLDPGF